MKGVNKVILLGNLGRDPDVTFIEGNICVAKFNLATTEYYRDKNGTTQSQTEWHNIVLWRSLAELAIKNLKKGSSIYLEGKLKTKTWEDKNGIKKQATEIVGDSFVMLDKRGEYFHPNNVESIPLKTEIAEEQIVPPANETLPF